MIPNCTIVLPPPATPWLAQQSATVLEWFDTDRLLAAVMVEEGIIMLSAPQFKFIGGTLPQSIRTYSDTRRVRVIGEKE